MKSLLLALIISGVGLISLSLSTAFHDNYPEEDPDDCLDGMKVPNRFTPDGDDTNDVYMIDFPCPPESFEVQITDGEGNEVYVAKSSKVEWDGNDKENQPCVSGIYSWKMAYMYHMRYVERKGQLLLLR